MGNQQIIDKLAEVTGHTTQEVADELMSCAIAYASNNEYNDVPAWLADACWHDNLEKWWKD